MRLLERLSSDIQYYRTLAMIQLIRAMPYYAALALGRFIMLIRELKKGKIIGVIVDQRGKARDGHLCNIFGLPAPTNPAPSFLAIKGDVLVQGAYIVKLNGTYHIRIDKAVDCADFGKGNDAIQQLSDYMQSWVASKVEKYPDQWFWLHSRWVKRNLFRNIKTVDDFKHTVVTRAEEIRSQTQKS
jgi:Kdo2-lipid IVA lauroyltransferase/acyltransferase